MKKTLVIFLLVVVFVVGFGAYTAFAGFWIEGLITDSSSGKPVEGSIVTIAGVSTTTDNQGKFTRWLAPFPSTPNYIFVEHSLYQPFLKYFDGVDFSKPIEIKLDPETYEGHLVKARDVINRLNGFVLETTSTFYEKDKKTGKVTINKGEAIYGLTENTRYFVQIYSNNIKGELSKSETIIEGSDHSLLDTISATKSGISPVVCYVDDQIKDWIKFKLIDDPVFQIPMPEVNPRKMLEPLMSFGNTKIMTPIADAGKSADGEKLIGATLSWDPKSILVGKTVQIKYRPNGLWYEIVFIDTGENPASKPGKYTFTLLSYDQFTSIKKPANAKEITPSELIGK
ncbi:MAG TPA: carboxypeptidase-like regulatory domain-containing protein [Caldisericia bacterium]|nr:carboxypeptidase-like regulatory domain-containing protein [Caldisericia bacterium]